MEEKNRCTQCGSEDLTVKLRELALIPGLGEKESNDAIHHTQFHQRLCRKCYEQANKKVMYKKTKSHELEI